MTSAMAAARPHFPPAPPAVPGAPGPFAFADPKHVRSVLEQAGFADVAITPLDLEMGGHSLEDALTLALRVGPVASLLRAHPEVLLQVSEAVRAALVPCVREGAVWQVSATWIVTAKSP